MAALAGGHRRLVLVMPAARPRRSACRSRWGPTPSRGRSVRRCSGWRRTCPCRPAVGHLAQLATGGGCVGLRAPPPVPPMGCRHRCRPLPPARSVADAPATRDSIAGQLARLTGEPRRRSGRPRRRPRSRSSPSDAVGRWSCEYHPALFRRGPRQRPSRSLFAAAMALRKPSRHLSSAALRTGHLGLEAICGGMVRPRRARRPWAACRVSGSWSRSRCRASWSVLTSWPAHAGDLRLRRLLKRSQTPCFCMSVQGAPLAWQVAFTPQRIGEELVHVAERRPLRAVHDRRGRAETRGAAGAAGGGVPGPLAAAGWAAAPPAPPAGSSQMALHSVVLVTGQLTRLAREPECTSENQGTHRHPDTRRALLRGMLHVSSPEVCVLGAAPAAVWGKKLPQVFPLGVRQK